MVPGATPPPGEISIDGPLTGYCPGGASDTPDPAARETEIGWLIFRPAARAEILSRIVFPWSGLNVSLNGGLSMPGPNRTDALDHVVVLMFENRSFDNLLGRLYPPGEVESFEGVIGQELSNPVPEWAEHGAGRKVVPYGVAPTMNTPSPDPGEEYPHINTQLFGTHRPEEPRHAGGARWPPRTTRRAARASSPRWTGSWPTTSARSRPRWGASPRYDEYAQIMTGYTPEQLPVVSALARGFAVFDHWFCEVPSQTFTNRSFFHAGHRIGLRRQHVPCRIPSRFTTTPRRSLSAWRPRA